jgi:ABC-type transport system substrate-binding protein
MAALWKKGLAVLSSAALAATILAGCGGSTTNGTNDTGNAAGGGTGAVKTGGTIEFDANDDISHFDPALAYDQGAWEYVWGTLYNQLVTYKPQSTELVPDLATDMPEVSADGLTYTFHLRKDVVFSNGDPVTAQSFIDEFKRILTKSLNSPAVGFIDPAIKGADDFYNGKAKEISGLEAPDPYTLKITLTKPEPFFLKILAMPFFSPVDMKYIKSIGDKAFDHKPLGTGPFKMESYDFGKQFVLVKNDKYFDKSKPKLDKIIVHIQHNQETTGLSFEQGKTALMGDYNQAIPPQFYVKWAQDPQYSQLMIKQPFMGIEYLGLNTQIKPFNNPLVRKAINMAINKDKLVKLANGRAVVANQILPPGIQGHEDSLPADVDYKYNPDEAKKLLAQAGYPNGFKTEMLVRNREPFLTLAPSIQADLKAIGIDVSIHLVGQSDYLDKAESGKEPMGLYGWFADFPDPYDFLDVLLNSKQAPINNWANYKNPEIDKLLNQAATMKEGPERYKLYEEIQNKILADAPWVPLYVPTGVYIHQPWLKGYYTNPVMEDPLADIWVDKQ